MDLFSILKNQYKGNIGDCLFEIINPIAENHVATFAYIGDDFILSFNDVERKIKIISDAQSTDVNAVLKDIHCTINVCLNEDDILNDVAFYVVKFFDEENNLIKMIVSGGYTFPSSVFVIEGAQLASYLDVYGDVQNVFDIVDLLDVNPEYAKCAVDLETNNFSYLISLIKETLNKGVSRKREDNKSN
ncbi:MAG: hypothetical protein IJA94_00270 [Bacilli bacterium]|nr:hypothetical protein [Bacilli bacterium]